MLNKSEEVEKAFGKVLGFKIHNFISAKIMDEEKLLGEIVILNYEFICG